MSQHNPELRPPTHPHPDAAIQPDAPDFIETPDVVTTDQQERLPAWIYLVCGFALFMAGSSFTGFGLFGQGLYDQGMEGASTSKAQTQEVAITDPILLGKKIYANNCANCHHADGEGQAGMYPPMGKSEWVIGPKDRLAAILIHGLNGPVTVRGASYGSAVMPAWQFPDDQMANLMTYLRKSWGNSASEVTSADVSAARAQMASQVTACTESDLMKMPDAKK